MTALAQLPFVIDKAANTDRGFSTFWDAWPRDRRVAKRTAFAAYLRALRRATADEIVAGAIRYASERDGQDHRFTKHPTTWLNGDCWEDSAQETGTGTFMDIEQEIRGSGS